ncbi:hypothetical protein [Streptomyces capillispiralis]|uniref:Uncharacterized protein n=1 Tax=Streptomyces capillispiralis TaxID=68182 RepID=A0A561TBM5_9ACTN|nr:hypothetical protein [Streptomyces capillispiralis]TWF84499.1 hypothetical protein FHX78_111433 [Streptomyces capillispiralis]GHH92045.1 hypothetical protein GCM10017779_25020 [Streptomyces capillispiralis]
MSGEEPGARRDPRAPRVDQRVETGDNGFVVQGRDIDGRTFHTVNTTIRAGGWAAFLGLLVAAVGAVFLYVHFVDDAEAGSGPRSSLASDGTASGVPRAEGQDDAGTRSPPGGAAAEPSEQWRGTLVLDLYGKELDADPPAGDSSFLGTSDITIGNLGSTQVMAGGGVAVAQWEVAGRTPGHAECAEAAATAGSIAAPARRGAVLCVRTDEGRIARLVVTGFAEGFSPAVKLDAVVWELSEEAASDGTLPDTT